uniref:hypothetical protein n=1 Tax=Vibrio splendidus TaxID=29497 RepID=UPI0018E46318
MKKNTHQLALNHSECDQCGNQQYLIFKDETPKSKTYEFTCQYCFKEGSVDLNDNFELSDIVLVSLTSELKNSPILKEVKTPEAAASLIEHPLFFKEIIVSNHPFIENHTIKIPSHAKQDLILTGKNGSGKSTLLSELLGKISQINLLSNDNFVLGKLNNNDLASAYYYVTSELSNFLDMHT